MGESFTRKGGGTEAKGGESFTRPGSGTAAAAPKKKGFWGRAKEDLKNTVSGVPRGILGMGKDAATDLNNTFNPRSKGWTEGAKDGESLADYLQRRTPLVAGLGESFGRTGFRLGQGAQSLAPGGLKPSESSIARDYSNAPVSTLVEDAANLAVVLAPAAKALGGGSKAASAAGKPALAAKLQKAADVATVGRDVTRATGNAPVSVPMKVLGKTVAPAGKALIERAAASQGTTGTLVRGLKLDAASRSVTPLLREGEEAASEATGRQVALSRQIAKILPDAAEANVARLIGEGEAPSIAAARANIPAEQFDTWVAENLKVTPAIANMAADVVDGKLPELSTRIDEALKVGHEGPGGRAERTENYLAQGKGREWEVGFEPSQLAIDKAIEQPLVGARKAANLAEKLRLRAEVASAKAGDVGADASAAQADLTGRVTDVQRSAVDLDRAVRNLRPAVAAGGKAESTLTTRAERAAATQARQEGARAVRETRRAVQAELRQAADELRATFEEMGRPAKPPTRLPSGVRSPLADAAAALEAGVGAKWAGHNLWAKDGMPLDVWLDEWNRRHNVANDMGGGLPEQAVLDHVSRALTTAAEAKALASGALGKGFDRSVFQHVNSYGDEAFENALVGTVDEAVTRLSTHKPGLAGEAAIGQAVSNVQRGVGRKGGPEAGLAKMFGAREAVAGAKAGASESAAGLRSAITEAGNTRAQLGALQGKARTAESMAAMAEKASGRAAEKVRTTAAITAKSIDAAPARLRPALIAARSAQAEMKAHAGALRDTGDTVGAALVEKAAAELPTTLKALKDSGVDYDHFIHIKVGASPGPAPSAVALPKRRRTSEERFRKGSVDHDRTIPAQAKAEIKLLREGIARETFRKIESLPMARKFATAAEAAEAGYVAWDPGNIFEKSANPPPNSTYIPEHVFRSFRSYFVNPKWDDLLGATYDKGINGFKVAVLPLSPSWQVGNLAGNVMLATIAGGVSPPRLAKSLAQAVKEYRASSPKGERSFQGPRRLYTSGSTHAEFAFLKDAGGDAGGSLARRAARKGASPLTFVVRKSYAMNAFVDDLGRSAVHIAKKAEGLSDEAAMREALKAMGDFSRMTPFERRVVKRIVPFYAWQRHMTQLAFRLPLEHPVRVAWTLHIAAEYGQLPDDLQDLPPDQRGVLPWGDKLIGTRNLFPFGDAGKILTPAGLRQSLSPILKVAGQSGTGLNMFTGRPFTRPAGTARRDDFERELPTAPSFAKQVTDVFPQKRFVDNLRGRDSVVRYDSGDKVLTKEGAPIPTGKTGNQALIKWLGLSVTERQAAIEAAKRAKKAQEQLDKAKASYEKRAGK